MEAAEAIAQVLSSATTAADFPPHLAQYMREMCPIRPFATVQAFMFGSIVAGHALNRADYPESRAVFAASGSGECARVPGHPPQPMIG